LPYSLAAAYKISLSQLAANSFINGIALMMATTLKTMKQYQQTVQVQQWLQTSSQQLDRCEQT